MTSEVVYMNRIMTFLKKNAYVVLSLASAFIFASCEIGLGSAVDTVNPVVAVTNPAVNAVVGKSFSIQGTCTDDGEVDYVKIARFRSSTDPSINFTNLGNAVLWDDKNNWSVLMKYIDESKKYLVNGQEISLPDGTYVIDVVGYDKFGRESTAASGIFDIDNTAPIFLSSKPASIEGDAGASSYGRSVYLSGKISDSHGVASMDLRVWDSPTHEITTSLGKTHFTGFADKTDLNIEIARYFKDSSSLSGDKGLLYQNYLALFGKTPADDLSSFLADNNELKTFYATVVFTDVAGNSSSYVYLSDVLNSLGASEIWPGNTDLQVSASDYKNILTGSYTGILDADAQAKVVAALTGDTSVLPELVNYNYLAADLNSVQNGKKLILSANPNSSPTYDITDSVYDGTSFKQKGLAAELYIKIAKGLDDSSTVRPDTLAAYIYPANSVGVKTSEEPVVVYDKEHNTDKFYRLNGNTKESVWSGWGAVPSESFEVWLELPSEGLANGSYYVVEIIVTDATREPIYGVNNIYGFQIASYGTAPTIAADDHKVYKQNDAVGVSGKYPVFPITINDTQGDLYQKTFGAAVEYEVKYYAGHFDSVSLITGGELNTVSGSVLGNDAAITDDGTHKSYSYGVPLVTPSSLGDADNYTVYIRVKANNKTANGQWYDYLLYADNKAPAVEITNTELVSTNAASYVINKDSAYIRKNSAGDYFYELHGNWSDVDGAGTQTLEYSLNNGTDWSNAAVSVPGVGEGSAPQVKSQAGWTAYIPLAQGTGKSIWVRAKDSVGNETPASKFVKRENISVDYEAPKLNRTSPASVAAYYNGSQIFEFTATDTNSVSDIEIKAYKDDASVSTGYTVSPGTPGTSFVKTVTLNDEGRWKIEATAKDAMNQTSTPVTVETTLDKTAPSVPALTVTGTKNNDYYTSTTLKVDGTSKEVLSGLQYVDYYVIDSTGKRAPLEDASPDYVREAASGSGDSVTFSITPTTFSAADGGINKLYVRLVDKAGNTSGYQETVVKVDEGAPNLTVAYYDSDSAESGGLVATIPNKVYINNNSVALYGLASDASGIASITFKIGNAVVTPALTVTTDALSSASTASDYEGANWVALSASNAVGVKAWRAVITKTNVQSAISSNPDTALIVTATDKAGLSISRNNCPIFAIDAVAPTFVVSNLESNGKYTESSAGSSLDVDKHIYTVSGTWSDADSGTGVLQYKLGNGSWTDVTSVAELNASVTKSTAATTWKFDLPHMEGSVLTRGVTKGAYPKVSIRAVDQVGNISAEQSFDGIVFDFSNPTLTSSPELAAYTTAATTTITLSAVDDYMISSIDVVAKKNGEVTANGSGYTVSGGSNIGTAATGENITATRTITLTAPAADGVWTFEVTAKDAADRKATLSLSTTVDATKPAVDTGLTIGGNAYDAGTYFKTTSLKVAGTVTEATSGIDTVYYLRTAEGATVSGSDITGETGVETVGASKDTATGKWNFNFTPSTFEEDAAAVGNTLYIQVKDKAGNLSEPKTYTVHIDQKAPVVEAATYSNGGDETSTQAGIIYYKNTSPFVIKGTVEETGSGLDSLIFTGVTNPTVKYSTDGSSYSDTKTGAAYWQATISTAQLGALSGTTELTVQGKDKAGNLSVVKKICTLQNDNTPPVLEITSPAAGTALITESNVSGTGETRTLTVAGKWHDDISGTKLLEYSTDNGTTWLPVTSAASAGNIDVQWTFTVPVEEGSGKSVQVRATDNAGNTSTAISRNFDVDFSAPSISLSVPSSLDEYYKYSSEPLSVTVSASDSRNVVAIEVESATLEGSATTLIPGPTGLGSTAASSTFSLKRDGSVDGQWKITIKAKDGSGRYSEPLVLSTYIDGTVPAFVSDTDAVNPLKINGENYSASRRYFNVTNLKFDGFVKEEHSGPATLYYLVNTEADINATALKSDPGVKTLNFSGTSGAAVSYSITPTISAGSYVHMMVADKAGNESSVKHYQTNLDQTAPEVGVKFYTYSNAATGLSNTDVIPGTLYVNTSNASDELTLYGSVQDSGSGLSAMTFTKGGTAWTPSSIVYSATEISDSESLNTAFAVNTTSPQDNSVSWKAVFSTNSTSAGQVAVSVSDNAGNSNSQSLFSLQSDTTAPALKFTNSEFYDGDSLRTSAFTITEESPFCNSTGPTYTLNGTWSDVGGAGTSKLYYSTTTTNNATTTGWTEITSAVKGTAQTSWTQAVDVSEGTGKQFAIYAVDALGNKSSVVKVDGITFDFGKPTITTTTVPASTRTDPLSITVTVRDSFGFAAASDLTVKAYKNGSETATASGSGGYTFTPGAFSAGTKEFTGTIKLTGSAADGVWKFVLNATDSNGRAADTVTINTKYDVTAPVIDGNSVKINDEAVRAYYKDKTLKITGTIAENGVGLAHLYYFVNYPGRTGTVVDGSTVNMSTSSYYDSFQLFDASTSVGDAVGFEITPSNFATGASSSVNKVYLQAEDALGNLSEIYSLDVTLDTKAPTFNRFFAGDDAANLRAISASEMVKTGGSVTVWGVYNDDVSGVDALEFATTGTAFASGKPDVHYYYSDTALNAGTVESFRTWINSAASVTNSALSGISDANRMKIKAWSAVFPAENAGTITATTIDRAGNSASGQTVLTLTLDSTSPEIGNVTLSGNSSYNSAADTYFLNPAGNTFSISGVTTDDIAVGKTELVITPVGGTGSAVKPTAIETGSWSFSSLSMSAMKNAGATGATATITAYDKAGNTATKTLSITFDGTAPVLEDSTFVRDYTFRGETVRSNSYLFIGKGRYSSSSYGQVSSVDVETNYTDGDGSGIAEVLYQLVPAGASATEIIDKEHPDRKTGTLVVGAKGPRGDASPSGYTSAAGTVSGLKSVSGTPNKLYVMARDYCGNYSTVKELDLLEDQTVPSVARTGNDAVLLTNGTAEFSVSGTAADYDSGLAKLRVYIGDTVVFATEKKDEVTVDAATGTTTVTNDYGTFTVNTTYEKDGVHKDVLDNAPTNATWTVKFNPASGTWFNALEDGTAISVEAEDWAQQNDVGNNYRVNLATIQKDTTVDPAQNVTLSGTAGTYWYDEEHDVYYIRSSGNTFTISGVSSDTYGLDSTTLTIRGKDADGNDTADTYSPAAGSSLNAWSFSGINLGGFTASTGAEVTVTVKDKAGNTDSTAKLSIRFDNAAPQAMHEFDAKNKDLYFRIGGDNDTDVGGKYSTGKWSNSTSLRVRGFFTDGDSTKVSGISKIYYQLSSSESGLTLNASNYTTAASGSFEPCAEYEKSVSKNIEGGEPETVVIPTSFDTTISGLSVGTNYLRLLAVDKVGNAALDSVDGTGFYQIKVDNAIPQVAADIQSQLTNGISTVTLTGTATDPLSGVASVEFYVGKEEYKISSDTTTYGTVELGAANGSGVRRWTLTLNNTDNWLRTASENEIGTMPAVYANVTDNAGNVNTGVKVSVLQIDTEAPTVSLLSPTTWDGMNGIYSVRGNVGDNNIPKSIALYTYIGNSVPETLDGGWNLVGKKTTASGTSAEGVTYNTNLSNIYNFVFPSFDVNGFAGENGVTATAYLLLVAEDEAGNKSLDTAAIPAWTSSTGGFENGYRTLSVDRNADRPVVVLNNIDISQNPIWVNTHTIYGNVIDDDGVTSMQYRIGEDGSFQNLPVTNGSWTLTLPNSVEDGLGKTLYFKVEDGAGTTFVSKADAADSTTAWYDAPKLRGSAGAADGTNDSINKSILTFNLDTNAPLISDVTYTAYDSSNSVDLQSSDDFTQPRFGGRYTKFKVQFKATDSSGIKYGNEDGTVVGSTVTFNGTDYELERVGETDFYRTKDYIDLSTTDFENKNQEYTLKATAMDGAGQTHSISSKLTVDNVKPVIAAKSPNAMVSASATATGTVSDRSDCEVYFMVSDDDCDTDEEVAAVTATIEESETEKSTLNANNRWRRIWDAASTWQVYFDDDFASTDGFTHTELLKWYLTSEGGTVNGGTVNGGGVGYTTVSAITSGAYTTQPWVRLHIKAVDAYGNVGYGEKRIQVEPQGDKPTVTMAAPAADLGKATYTAKDKIMGGTIMVYGTAVDTKGTHPGAQWAWLLIDMNNDGTYDYSDISALNTLMDTDWTWYYYDPAKSPSGANGGVDYQNVEFGEIPKAADTEFWRYGLKMDATSSSWQVSLNGAKFVANEATGQKSIGIWVYATDFDGYHSPIDFSTTSAQNENMPHRVILVDKNTPMVANEKLLQYGYDGNGAEVTAEQAYSEGIAIRKVWYYEADIYDREGIGAIYVDDGTEDVKDAAPAGMEFTPITEVPGISDEVSGYHIKVRLGIDDSETVRTDKRKITFYEVKDSNPLSNFVNIEAVVDNLAPELIAEGDYYSIPEYNPNDASTRVVNRGDFFTFGAQATEVSESSTNQTGVKRIAFYITRDIDTGNIHKIYDPMLVKAEAGLDYTSGNTNAASGIFLNSDDNLYWKRLSVTGPSGNAGNYTLTLGAVDKNVHVGGLIKVNSVIYKISALNGTEVTVDAPSLPASVTSADFAIANVVDNTTAESTTGGTKNAAGYYVGSARDDGDCMVESLSKSGTTWTWEASINSKNIGDGLAELHYVVFDEAGNSRHESVTIFVGNNQPRVAGMSIGTDSDGSGNVEAGEIISKGYSGIYPKGKQGSLSMTDAWFPEDKASSVLKLKGKTLIKPEIVGGNGALSYAYNVYPYADGSWSTTSTISGSGNTGETGNEESEDAQVLDISIDTIALLPLVNNDNYNFRLAISDSTPGGSMTAYLNIIVDTLLKDINLPVNRIMPFYWVDAENNSLFMNSKEHGHIELSSDLPDETFDGSGVFDKDDKVSGIIKIEGVAQDDVLLSEIKVQIAGEDYKVGGYENGAWTYTKEWDGSETLTEGWASKVDKATYQQAYDMGCITLADAYKLGVSSSDSVYTPTDMASGFMPYISDYGHIVHWTLCFDTSTKIGVGIDKTIVATAIDRGEAINNSGEVGYAQNSWTEAGDTVSTNKSAEGGNPTGYMRMDVVPYITKISTTVRSASGLKDTNIRSASGKYSILANNTANAITVNGFNFSTSNLIGRIVDSDTDASATSSSGVAVTLSVTDSQTATIKNSGITKSGYLELFSDGVRALNNINSNDSYGSAKNKSNVPLTAANATVSDYANAYNREPDYYTTKNVQLTDDRYLVMFDMHTAQTPSGSNAWKDLKNAYYPVMVMNGDNPVFGYMNGSGGPSVNTGTAAGTGAGGYYASHAMPQRAEFNGTSGAEVYTEYLIKASAWDGMGMAVDEGGRYYNVSSYNRDGSAMSLIYDRYAELHNYTYYGTTYYYGLGWGAGTGYTNYENYNGNSSNDTGNNAITLDSMNYSTGVLLGRYMYPKLIANGNSKTGTAKVYMAYYDDGTGEIVFRNFQLGRTVSGTATALDSSHTDKNGTTYKQYVNFTENTANSADYTTGRLTAVAKGSKYYDMAVTSDNHVVIVYYDEDESKLKLIYSTNAVDGSSPTANVAWTTSSVSFPSYAGTYVSMAIDSSNGLHIAAFDASDADLKYFYLPSYSSTSLTNITVDAAGSVGQWTGIAICTDSSNTELYGKPVISYYNSTETGTRESIKMAYPKSAIGSIETGIDANGYTTGNWEYMTVPAITPPQGGDAKFQKVCLGFDTSGTPVLGFCATNLEFGKQFTE
ncbi:MAG: hypothetical protein J5930_04000 [Treponema sp.]|nr:hypothetical protein [Treponema sp.]